MHNCSYFIRLCGDIFPSFFEGVGTPIRLVQSPSFRLVNVLQCAHELVAWADSACGTIFSLLLQKYMYSF